MKPKLETIANFAVIIAALAVGYAVLRERLAAPRIPRSVSAGDRLAPVAGVNWTAHRRTLVLALNTACHYCRDSAPFYRKLAHVQHAAGNYPEIVAVFPNEPEAVRQFAREEGLALRSIAATSLERLGVVATPTLLLVDREGQVERAWVGVLTSDEERDVLQVATRTGGER